MKLFSSVFSWEVAAIFLMTFSFVVDGNLNPINIGLFDRAERSLSLGYSHARVAAGNKSGHSKSEETQKRISQTKSSLASVDVAQIEPRQFTGGSATKNAHSDLDSTASNINGMTTGGNTVEVSWARDQLPVYFAYSASVD